MAEYIEREALLNRLKAIKESADWDSQSNYVLFGIKEFINNAPAADVVEVVHGEWVEHEWAEEENGLLISNFECSVCRNWERKKSDYCPNCGAKMKGE